MGRLESVVVLRQATVDDVDAIAGVHAESWRTRYRGTYSDAFLDGPVFADRQGAWADRLGRPAEGDDTVVAVSDGVVVGFVHTILDADPDWGALLDNLHVTPDLHGSGIGTRLMARSAAAVLERAPHPRLFLWVLEANRAAQAFYEARGGVCVSREAFEEPGGGQVWSLRYAWPDPSILLLPSTGATEGA